MTVKVIISESHTLGEEQRSILDREFPGKWETLQVPASGWSLEEMQTVAGRHFRNGDIAVFVSPVPALLSRLAFSAGAWSESSNNPDSIFCGKVLVFHNDNREAKELPNGKIVHTVASTGWQLV